MKPPLWEPWGLSLERLMIIVHYQAQRMSLPGGAMRASTFSKLNPKNNYCALMKPPLWEPWGLCLERLMITMHYQAQRMSLPGEGR